MKILEGRNLSLLREDIIIFKEVHFKVQSGKILLIQGNNGCGKTSLLKGLMGLIPFHTGEILINGSAIKKFLPDSVYVGHKNACIPHLTVLDNLLFWAKVKKTEELVMASAHIFELQRFFDLKYCKLSEGWKKRVSLAKILIFDADIWVLDEPFVNLDDDGCVILKDLIQTKKERDGVILITESKRINLFKDAQTLRIGTSTNFTN